AESVVAFFASEENQRIISRLKEFGVQMEISAEKLANQSDKLKGLIFVVSGVFETVSRDELKQLIEDNGGKVSSSISSKTSFVVAGENMGPSKKQKAESLGVS
ncbi:MAG: NAD-dependent DNA ligase LigA, partial [Flavobacteriaceae bacterium]|nr:NAD-dependent DNA ligase LigA [Flavobacteriaceae bacterium]